MFKLINVNAKYKLRDINIAIEVERNLKTLREIAESHDMDKERVRIIHSKQLGAILKQVDKYYPECAMKPNRSPEQLRILIEYKKYLESRLDENGQV